ncbi:ParA family protein [Alphaproteobacteria bacterium endosymbiont of Tiliacea citrago]|uniref:ParA family protein n=1 Tax=Alphaproteobacteria bacterium endosymbiont of Tiliacea citrago TaxID=3077944 RepID=UPI00313DE10B
MKIISIANQKGGVAKTTSAINISYYLAELGYKTLLIDFDPQASASSGLGFRKVEKSIYELLYGHSYKDVEVTTNNKNLYVIPSNQNLAAFEFEAMLVDRKESKLKDVLTSIKEFDFVIVDCPPSLGLLTINALVASEYILIPVQTEFFALEGLSLLLETAAKVKKRWNMKLEVMGIILTMCDKRNMHHREVIADIKHHFGAKVFQQEVRRNIRLAEAASFGKSICEYDKKSIGAQIYKEIVFELLKKVGY